MSINLLETLQTQLGYPALQKIDPNTQMVKEDEHTPNEHQFSQAAIPAVLIALYNYSATDVGAEMILNKQVVPAWSDLIFTDNKELVVQHIAAYANYTTENTTAKLNSIAATAISIIHTELPAKAGKQDVKKFMHGQRDHILPFLPAALQMGKMLHNNTLDDQTNKMEGPASSMVQALGGSFSA